MRTPKTAVDPRPRAGEVRTFHPDIFASHRCVLRLFNDWLIFLQTWPSDGCMAHPSRRGPAREVIVNLREGLMSPYWYDTTGRRESGTTSASFGADQNREAEKF
jgi:hypothetical protein